MGLLFTAPKLEIITWDVQHGDAILIKTPNDKIVVLDLGIGSFQSENERFSPLNHLLIKYGISKIDCLLITHPHKDHIEDIESLRHFKINRIITSQHIPKTRIGKNALPRDESLYRAYKKLLTESYLPSRALSFGELKLKIFSPYRCSLNNLNNHSLVVVLLFGDLKFVITGDNEFDSLDELIHNQNFRKYVDDAHILWAPHHGRESAFHYHFVKRVNPLFTIISDDKNIRTSAANKYARMSEGDFVTSKSVGDCQRKLLTTRKDGVIRIKAKINFWGESSFDVFVK